MNIIEQKFLPEESFVENAVLRVDLDINNKLMSIETDGADLCEIPLLKAKIVIEDWCQFDVIERDTNKKLNIDPKKPKEFLSNIYEFHYDGNTLRLVDVWDGWVDWIFIKPKVTVYGEIDPNPPVF
jgi:hypothetical protein